MNKGIKTIAALLIATICIYIAIPNFYMASSVGDKGTVYMTDGIMTLSDGHKLNFKCIYNSSSKSYETAYCIEHGSSLYSNTSVTASDMESIISSKDVSQQIRLVMSYGYYSNTDISTSMTINSSDGQRYAATQFIIWNVLAGNYDSGFNRTASWYDYIPSNSTYKSSINDYIKSIENSIKKTLLPGNTGINVYDSKEMAEQNFNYASYIDNDGITNVKYYFDYELPSMVSLDESNIVSNTSSSVSVKCIDPAKNKWRVVLGSTGKVTFKVNYGNLSYPVVWIAGSGNYQKVVSIPSVEHLYKYVSFAAEGSFIFNPSSTPVPTVTPTDNPISDNPVSIQLIKKGNAYTSSSVISKSLELSNEVTFTENITIFNSNCINLSGAVFYAVPREDVYRIEGTDKNLFYAKIYSKNQPIGLSRKSNGVYMLDELYEGTYDIYEEYAPQGYVANSEIIATVEVSRSLDDKSYIEYINSQTTGINELVDVSELGKISFINEPVIVEVSIDKNLPIGDMTDEEYVDALSSIVFGIYTREEFEFFENETIARDTLVDIGSVKVETDSQGSVLSANCYFECDIPDGNYYVKEISAAPCIAENDNEYELIIDRSYNHEKTITVKYDIDNDLVKGKLVVYKYDSWYGTSLTGATFAVYDSDGNCYGVMSYDDDNNRYYIDVPYGDYTVVELESPEGYMKNDTIYSASITKNNEEFVITDFDAEGIMNSPFVADLIVYKVDVADSHLYLSGAEFELYNDTNCDGIWNEGDHKAVSLLDGELVEVSIDEYCDENGVIYYKSSLPIRAGVYFVVETKCPDGYSYLEDNDCVTTVSLPQIDNETDKVELFINNKCYGDIHISKVDHEYPDNKLGGATFAVYIDSNSNDSFDIDNDSLVGYMEEEELGEYYIRNLGFGTYFVREVKSPVGFKLRDDIWTVRIHCDKEVYEITDSDFDGLYNDALDGSITVIKCDGEDNLLSGAVFEVYYDANNDGIFDDSPDSSDLLIGRMVDDDNDGYYKLSGLKRGVYFVREVEAPSGYNIDDNYYKVTITLENLDVFVTNNDGNTFINSLITPTPTTPTITNTGEDVNRNNTYIAIVFIVSSLAAFAIYLVFRKERSK